MPSRKDKTQELPRFSGQLTQKRNALVIGWRDGDAPAEYGGCPIGKAGCASGNRHVVPLEMGELYDCLIECGAGWRRFTSVTFRLF